MAATSKSKKLKRLVSVQRQLEKMAESDLAATTRYRHEVNESMDVVIQAIGSIDGIHSLFTQHYSERFGRLSVRDQQLAGIQQVQEMKIMRERAKGDRLEENMKEARTLEERGEADESIYDLVDQLILKNTPASSKVEKP